MPTTKRKAAKKAAAKKAAAKKRGLKPEPVTGAFTVARFAQLTGFDRHSLASRIEEMRLEPVGHSRNRTPVYSIRDLVRGVLGGDIEAERLRKTREEADKLALANARSRGELVDVSSVRRLGQQVMSAVRNRILSMPLTDDEKDGCLRELLSLADMDWSREG
jgi:hypothetical protein